jgi:hypothetical protein
MRFRYIAAIALALCLTAGADPDLPRHFTLVDETVAAGELVTVPLWVEKYEAAHVIHLRFEMDPSVAEFVGALPGHDLKVLAQGGCWNMTFRSWVQTANERPEHEGWQLNYLRFGCFTGGDDCDDGITGPIGAHREIGFQTAFHVADLIIRGVAAGVTPIWIDRDCNGEPGGGGGLGSRDSHMSFFPEDICPGQPGSEGASFCIKAPGDGPFQYVTLSPEFLPAPTRKAGESADPRIVVTDDDCDDDVDDDDECTAVTGETWGRVKGLYR